MKTEIKTLKQSLLDETSQQFSEHEDMIETLDQFARGQISEVQFLDQLRWMKLRAEKRAWKKVYEPDSESDWGDSRLDSEIEDEHAKNPGAA